METEANEFGDLPAFGQICEAGGSELMCRARLCKVIQQTTKYGIIHYYTNHLTLQYCIILVQYDKKKKNSIDFILFYSQTRYVSFAFSFFFRVMFLSDGILRCGVQGAANETSTAAAATEAVSSSTASLCTLAAGRSLRHAPLHSRLFYKYEFIDGSIMVIINVNNARLVNVPFLGY